jgi:predicted acylesterase/phospholipase RssA
MRANWLVLLGLAFLLAMPACSHDCVPKCLLKRSDLIDLSATTKEHVPFDAGPSREVTANFLRQAASEQPAGRPYQILLVGGGGLFASYSIGVLTGWSEAGTRPEFDIVTGSSAGALLATFAFLGSRYDDYMKVRMVGRNPREALRTLPIPTMLKAGAVYSTQPLTQGVYESITPEILREVACAHAAGRRLYIATTALDSRRMVLWDMGAIATRGDPEALELYRFVILASSAVPGALPPVLLPVEIDGVRYDEMHVDGAVSSTSVFTPNLVADLNRVRGLPGSWAPPGSNLYTIHNDRYFPEPGCTRALISSLTDTFQALYSNKTRDEMARVYLDCLRTGLSYHVTGIRPSLPVAEVSPKLSAADQEKLYQAGREVGRGAPNGMDWRDQPPGLEPGEQVIPRTGSRFATPEACCPR